MVEKPIQPKSDEAPKIHKIEFSEAELTPDGTIKRLIVCACCKAKLWEELSQHEMYDYLDMIENVIEIELEDQY